MNIMDISDLYNDIQEKEANYEFQKIFSTKYNYSKLKFYCNRFQDYLAEDRNTKKPLILYLHVENKQFCDTFCELINDPDIEKEINEHFHIIGWNLVGEPIFLAGLANKIPDNIITYVERKIPSIFFITPDMKVETCIEKEVSIALLEEAFLSCTLTASKKFQQWMFEEFSDRDYDSFECDQLELNNDKDKEKTEAERSILRRSLKDKILYAMYGPPKELELRYKKQSARDGRYVIDKIYPAYGPLLESEYKENNNESITGYYEIEIGYNEQENEEADKIFHQIVKINNQYSKWNNRVVMRIIYNCIEPLEKEKQRKQKTCENYEPENDFNPLPVFVLRKCKGKNIENPCRRYVDNNCRVYESWNEYLQKNTTPPGKMIFPKDGKYQSHPDKKYTAVWLKEESSPSCKPINTILRTTDIGSSAVGFLSAAAGVASMFTPLAVLTIPAAVGGIAAGSYSIGRSFGMLIDRSSHKQSINIANPESRGAYLNIAAGTFSAVGIGATKLMSGYAAAGTQISKSVQYGVNTINGTTLIISGTATVNSCYEVYQQCRRDDQRPSSLTVIQLASSMFFFANSVVNFRTASSIISEAQNNTINEISESLRSNRHRKTYNKLLKETIRTKGATEGKAEIISALRETKTRDDIIATLTRANKNFNKNGIRFSAGEGGIQLNGIKVDIIDFGNLPKTQQGVHIENLPPIPENYSEVNKSNTENMINNMKIRNDNSSPLGGDTRALNIIIHILSSFNQKTQQKIITICENLTNQLSIDIINIIKMSLGNFRTETIQFVINFIKIEASMLLDKYLSKLQNDNLEAVCKQFGFSNPYVTIKNFTEHIIDQLLNNVGDMMDKLIKSLYSWCTSIVANNVTKQETKEKRHHGQQRKKKQDCKVCGGYYYI